MSRTPIRLAAWPHHDGNAAYPQGRSEWRPTEGARDEERLVERPSPTYDEYG